MHFVPNISIAFTFVDAKKKTAEQNMKRTNMWVNTSKKWAAKIAKFRQIRSASRILSKTGTLYSKKPLNNQLCEDKIWKLLLKKWFLMINYILTSFWRH
jgi:hypothetical protein